MISKDQLTRSKVCQQCQHFRRHYVRQGRGRYIPIMVGHCVYPRLKGRAADTPACALCPLHTAFAFTTLSGLAVKRFGELSLTMEPEL